MSSFGAVTMQLTDEQITSYRALYNARFGKEISREDAYESGVKLLRLVELTFKPMTENEHQQLQKRRRETDD